MLVLLLHLACRLCLFHLSQFSTSHWNRAPMNHFFMAVQDIASRSCVSVPEFKKVRNQLTVRDGMLFWSYLDPVDGDIIIVGCMI